MAQQNIYDNEIFFEGYKRIRENESNANDLFEIPTLFSMMPDLKGKKVIVRCDLNVPIIDGKIIDNTKLAKVFLKRMHLLEKARLIREISSKAIANVSVVYTMTPSTDDNKQTTKLDVDINISRIDDNEDRQTGNITLTVDSDVIKQDEKKEDGEIIQKSAFPVSVVDLV